MAIERGRTVSDKLTIFEADGGQAERPRRDIEGPLGGDRQRRFRRFLMAAVSGVPWVGTLIGAAAALSAEVEQGAVNELHQDWLEAHRRKLAELATTLTEIVTRLEGFGDEVRHRMESDEYLALVRQAFRAWDQGDTSEKRRLIKHLLMNAGGTALCPDDLVRLFIQWIDYYHEAHFAVIRTIFGLSGVSLRFGRS